jgi:hypothetical protein
MPCSLGESTCGRVVLRALRIPRYVCKRGAHGPSLRSGIVFTFSLLCIDTCRVRAGMLWVPRIHFFLPPASPHFPLTMLLLRALNACISFLLLILLGCRQFCAVCLCSFCFASLWLTVLPLLVGAQLWSQVVSLVLFVLLHAILLFSTCVPLFPFCMLLVFCLNFLYLCFPCSNVPMDTQMYLWSTRPTLTLRAASTLAVAGAGARAMAQGGAHNGLHVRD